MNIYLPKLTYGTLRNYRAPRAIKYFHLYNVKLNISKFYNNVSSTYNIFQRSSKKYDLTLRGAILYENIVDKLNYDYFYKEFTMEDTFFSWFLVTELHVWMLMLRVMQEGEKGLNLRNYIVEAMWNDVNIRAQKLGKTNATVVKSNIKLLYEQFNASIIGYDETLGSNDQFLASHIWRRFFKCNLDNPEKLEKLVYYIRKQVEMLSHTTSRTILSPSPDIAWIYK